MTINLATTILVGVGIYFGIGGVVGLFFLIFIAGWIDHAARGASFLFRPMIFFGCIAVWPLLIVRILIVRILSFKKVNEPIGSKQ